MALATNDIGYVSKTKIKDSGKREVAESGMQRDTREKKGRFDLIPPIFLRRLARIYEDGAIKYDERNWEKGGKLSRFMDSALRHLNSYREGYRDEDHLTQAVWNIVAIIHFEELIARGLKPADLYDFPTYIEEEASETKTIISTDGPTDTDSTGTSADTGEYEFYAGAD